MALDTEPVAGESKVARDVSWLVHFEDNAERDEDEALSGSTQTAGSPAAQTAAQSTPADRGRDAAHGSDAQFNVASRDQPSAASARRPHDTSTAWQDHQSTDTGMLREVTR